MRNLSLIVSLLALTACSKEDGPRLGLIPGTKAPIVSNGVVLFLGQSNSLGLYNRVPNDVLRALQGRFPGVSSVLNCADGGQPLSAMEKGAWMYQACLDKIKNQNKVPALVIFWQGEAEPMNGLPVSDWAYRFQSMIASFRTDLALPKLPVLYVRLGDQTLGYATWNEMRQQQESVSIQHGLMVSVDGIPTEGGWVHYTDDNYREIARRIGYQAENL